MLGKCQYYVLASYCELRMRVCFKFYARKSKSVSTEPLNLCKIISEKTSSHFEDVNNM